MLRIISTKINHKLISALTEDFEVKEFTVSEIEANQVHFNIGDIVIGRITNIVRNIHSIFVEIFPGIEGYLNDEGDGTFVYANSKSGGKPVIGDFILVQISKEPTKTKSYTLTTDFTFMNKYLVLKPYMKKIRISSRFRSELNYKEIKEYFKKAGEKFLTETGSGFIARKSAFLLDKEELENQLYTLYAKYLSVIQRGIHGVQYERIFKEIPPHLTLIRDNHDEIEKIMTDEVSVYQEYLDYVTSSGCLEKEKVFLYQDEFMSLANLYSLRSTLEKCLAKKVWLKSGGYIVIEYTEALTVIDVNTGKAIEGKKSKSETFLKINYEAAQEIANQIRLRNLSGIIVVDFIEVPREQVKKLMKAMSDFLKKDSTNSCVIDITALGLMEITRRRSGKPLYEALNQNLLS